MIDTTGPLSRCLLVCALSIGSACRSERVTSDSASALSLIDSVRVQESDSQFIVRPVDLLVGPRGHYFVSDVGQFRVTELEPGGRIVRQYGRRGRGPGEFASPSWLATDGDSLLLVKDPGKQTIETFRIETGAYVRGMPMPRGSGTFRVRDGKLLLAAVNLASGSSLTTIDRSGVASFEGIVPPILQRLPILQGSFNNQAFAVDDSLAYSVFELDPAIFRWRRGTSKADMIGFPKRLRRGVATSDFDEMVRNPAKAAELAYNHSLPMQMTFASPWLLAIAMYDVDVVGQSFVGRYFVSYVDLREGRICPDLPVPVPTDPPARITFSADTIIAIQQMLNAAGKPTTAIRRFWFNGAGCAWQPLALP